MSYEICPTSKFAKRFKKLRLNDEQLIELLKILVILECNGHLDSGNFDNHKLEINKDLKKKYKKRRVFDCHLESNDEIVILYDFDSELQKVYLLDIGSHNKLRLENIYIYNSRDKYLYDYF